jgi:2-polyprenyl-6-methoxyphenol hydroxylase-like FAD-dependent oxidoreductase
MDHALAADLVVDAGGRRSQAPRWLTELGFPAPEAATIGVDMAYASAKFRVPAEYDEPARVLICFGPPPAFPNGGIMAMIEHQTWHVTLVGRFGAYPPHDAAGFLAYASALPHPKLYQLIKDAERVSEITPCRFPTSVLRHYDRLPTFPERFVVLGHALSSFSPVYGQGMSAAALQVQALQRVLRTRATGGEGLAGLARAFFPQAAEVIRTPWTLAASRDLAYPQTQGERPADLAKNAQYLAALDYWSTC